MDDKRLEAAMDAYGTWIKDHPVRLVKFDIAEDIAEQHKGITCDPEVIQAMYSTNEAEVRLRDVLKVY